jgi:hypothetical protein
MSRFTRGAYAYLRRDTQTEISRDLRRAWPHGAPRPEPRGRRGRRPFCALTWGCTGVIMAALNRPRSDRSANAIDEFFRNMDRHLVDLPVVSSAHALAHSPTVVVSISAIGSNSRRSGSELARTGLSGRCDDRGRLRRRALAEAPLSVVMDSGLACFASAPERPVESLVRANALIDEINMLTGRRTRDP